MAKISDLATTVNSQELAKTDGLSAILQSVNVKKRFEEVLGKKAPGFISSIISLVNANNQLKAADPKTVVAAAAMAASLDLPINQNLGFAYIIPYGDKAQFQMGYKGFIQLAIRTNQYATINATEVYEGELVSYNRITGVTEFDESKRKSDKIVGYVAYFKLLSGFEKWLYMTTEQVAKHAKRYSKSYNRSSSPWTTHELEMSLKTVIKLLLSKYGILSVEMQKALETDQGVIVAENGEEKVQYVDAVDGESVDQTPKFDMVGDAQEPV